MLLSLITGSLAIFGTIMKSRRYVSYQLNKNSNNNNIIVHILWLLPLLASMLDESKDTDLNEVLNLYIIITISILLFLYHRIHEYIYNEKAF